MTAKRLAAALLVVSAIVAAPVRSVAQDAERRKGFSVTIESPANGDVVFGKTKIAAKVKAPNAADVDRVEFLVGDKVVFVDRDAPYEAVFDFGETPKSWIVRAIAYHREGIRVSDAVVTRKIEVAYFEEVNRVILWATVIDENEQFVGDLGKDDFRLLEDGKEQTIQEFSAEDRPITMAILLDTSGSMKDRMKEVHAAAGAFVGTLRPEDRALVIAFDDKVFLLQDLTSDQAALEESVESTEAIGATAIYDALHAAFRKLKGIPGRKAIVLLSDGDDTSSQFGYQRILEEAKAQNVLIYGIGLGVGLLDKGRKNVLREFSDVTGGRAFFVGEAKQLGGAYQKIADELRKQYFLAYSTSNKTWDGRWIPVKLESRKDGLTVRARRGFFAVRAAAGATP
jgi:Ca-activated chloride channel homolog